ncbi:MAG: biopolymer transporter ExbD [Nitrosarchaeum sp.]|nr:biopolymer transporter ExbD [Nitrosarchaeum sp.]
MNLVPEEELKKQGLLNLAPMVDFLFLVVAVFAILAVTRASLHDANIELVKTDRRLDSALPAAESYIIDLTVTRDNKYKWLTEMQDYLINDPALIRNELLKQKQNGLLPTDTTQTKVLLHIDQGASWNGIARLILAVKEAGFQVHPVYELED